MNSLTTLIHKTIDTLFKKDKKLIPQRDPMGDWQRLIAIFSIIALVIVGVDGYFFYKINKGELFTAEKSTSSVELFDRSTLTKDNEYYSAKETRLSELKNSEPSVIDPSL
jgi:hypothetical protein